MLPKTWVGRGVLFGAVAVGFVLRAQVALTDDGIYWPDEIYQSFEPAHRLVFGYGFVAWEFIDGARNWALPAFVAFFIKLSAVFGGDSPDVYIRFTKLIFAGLSTAAAIGSYRLARVLGANELTSSAAAAVWSLCAPAIYFAPRAMSENASAATVIWALALLLEPDVKRRGLIIGASLLGVSVLFRLQTGLFAAGVLAVFASRRQWRPLREVAVVLGVWALIFGALDAFTWHDAPNAKLGGWFHSAVVYLRFNLIEGKAAQWGTSPPGFYAEYLWRSMPFVTALTVLGVVLSARKAPAAFALALAFFVVHSAIAHKEYRFILPMLPLTFALAAVGLSTLPGRLSPLGLGAFGAAALLSAGTASSLTWHHLGAYLDRPETSAWDDPGALNRLLLVANKQADLCGLRVDQHPAWHGGETYLHRNVPMHYQGTPPGQGLFNYAIVGAGSGQQVIAKEGRWELIKLPSACLSMEQQHWSWRLP